MKCPRELRREAERYRRLVAGVDDRRAIEAITELAAEYDELAAVLDRERRGRRRAYEMREEQGRLTAYRAITGSRQRPNWSKTKRLGLLR
jgi:hypothetical protein